MTTVITLDGTELPVTSSYQNVSLVNISDVYPVLPINKPRRTWRTLWLVPERQHNAIVTQVTGIRQFLKDNKILFYTNERGNYSSINDVIRSQDEQFLRTVELAKTQNPSIIVYELQQFKQQEVKLLGKVDPFELRELDIDLAPAGA